VHFNSLDAMGNLFTVTLYHTVFDLPVAHTQTRQSVL
jgi:hypothetical protein